MSGSGRKTYVFCILLHGRVAAQRVSQALCELAQGRLVWLPRHVRAWGGKTVRGGDRKWLSGLRLEAVGWKEHRGAAMRRHKAVGRGEGSRWVCWCRALLAQKGRAARP